MAQEQKRAQFEQENPYPFLVHVAANARLQENPWEERVAFSTDVRDFSEREEADDDDDDEEVDDPGNERAIVVPVRKRAGGLFTHRIGVGRARNCDVVLRFPSVSKLHAQFVIDGSTWSVLDVKSANGTLLNGVRLKPYEVVPVNLGDRLRLGEIEVELADAATVFERLRKLKP